MRYVFLVDNGFEIIVNKRKKKREEVIFVNCIICDDFFKGGMYNWELVFLRFFLKSLFDFDLWLIYLIGFFNYVFYVMLISYLMLLFKGMGFLIF